MMITRIVRLFVLVALGTLLAVQFWSLRTPTSLHLPPAQQVQTRNPKIGIHTRLTGIGDERYIEQSLRQVREMGASWIVDLFPWAYVQPRSRYGYDWAGADMVIEHARRQGLTVVARLDIVPEWARPHATSGSYIDPDHYIDYADYVVAFLRRYRPYGVRHVILWNEPNLSIEWGRRRPDPGAYAALLKVVYPRAKAAVPDAIVIAGALSPGADLGGGAERMSDVQYLASLYDAQAAPYFDMLAVHDYGYKSSPNTPPDPGAVNFRRVEVIHGTMAKFGDSAKSIMITEGGWNDNQRWSAAVLPSQRLRWTVEAYALAQQWPWLTAMCLWQLGLPQPTHTYQDNWNFVASDGTPKGIYWAVREAARGEGVTR
jgi:polysaccharide biosynthesis protein PslG